MRTALALLVLLPAAAQADTHSITIRNGTADTIRSVGMAPPGAASPGENRMRSQLPPGAEARITYSTGCRADVRLGYASGKTEDHPNVDVCAGATIVAGTEGVAGPTLAPTAAAAANTAAAKPGGKTPPGKGPTATPVAQAPPVPPWTGKSITKRFGGMD